MAAGVRPGDRRPAAVARPGGAREARCRQLRGGDDDSGPGREQRARAPRAWLAARVSDLARRLRGRAGPVAGPRTADSPIRRRRSLQRAASRATLTVEDELHAL